MNDRIVLRIEHIRKTFPGVVALDDVGFELREGEVHVLLGENGAGKSTLMKVLSGAYAKDAGRIVLHSREMEIKNPRHSRSDRGFLVWEETVDCENMRLGWVANVVRSHLVDHVSGQKGSAKKIERVDLSLRILCLFRGTLMLCRTPCVFSRGWAGIFKNRSSWRLLCEGTG